MHRHGIREKWSDDQPYFNCLKATQRTICSVHSLSRQSGKLDRYKISNFTITSHVREIKNGFPVTFGIIQDGKRPYRSAGT